MVPRVGWRNFVSRLKQVVFPAPFGPIRAWIVPRRTVRSTPRTARKPLNSFVRPEVARIASVMSDLLDRPLGKTDVIRWHGSGKGRVAAPYCERLQRIGLGLLQR